MRRQRLRPAYSDTELAALYARPHDHRRWPDHHLRVDVTLAVARWIGDDIRSAADLSCGNGHILRELNARRKYFGDYAPGYEYRGSILDTVGQLPEVVDLFVCSETIEHLDDPDKALGLIRNHARTLVLSTPVEAWGDPNPEHYWAWDRQAVEEMARSAGWLPHVYATADFRLHGLPYCFGIWGLL